jgi:hypothetical protein
VLDELLFWGLQALEDEKMLNELLFFGGLQGPADKKNSERISLFGVAWR